MKMNCEYIFPAIFHLNSDDRSYTITFPDLPGCISEGKSLGNAIAMAESALTEWISYLRDKGETIPQASAPSSIAVKDNEFVNLVRADIKDNRAIRRTVSIPKWMDDEVTQRGLSLSKVLQDTLKEKFSA